ncbi:uncharacterized protein LOC133194528 isoform X3 [Saccostrea echinata]|uniref:uncharacterized protein LOC133194528 isoform X3 n=1 Tax=Saccostrea echinata TaxID=191078 RepID=UPI002A82DC8B|nr:uncharacterized protein LOC133194528 isoform X3 [Saccostrea echinata]
MGIDTQAKRLLSILTFLFLMFLNPVQCARGSYCYYYYSVNGYKFYYCVYYYYNKSSTSSSSTGTITGAVIGGIVGFVILVAIVVIVCVKVCKKSKHGNVIVRTMQPTVPYISSTQNTYDGYTAYQPATNPVFPPPYQGPPGSTLNASSVPSYGDPPSYNGQQFVCNPINQSTNPVP